MFLILWLLFFIEVQLAKFHGEITFKASQLSHTINKVPLLLKNLAYTSIKVKLTHNNPMSHVKRIRVELDHIEIWQGAHFLHIWIIKFQLWNVYRGTHDWFQIEHSWRKISFLELHDFCFKTRSDILQGQALLKKVDKIQRDRWTKR